MKSAAVVTVNESIILLKPQRVSTRTHTENYFLYSNSCTAFIHF